MANSESKPKTPFDKTRFLRWLRRFMLLTVTPIGVIFGVAMFVLRSRGFLDASEYTTQWILFQTFWVAVAFPVAICTAFWVTNLDGSRKWFERLGFVMLFIVIPSILMLGLIRLIIGR